MPTLMRMAGAFLPVLFASVLFAQPATLPAPSTAPAVAATVNGQIIHEMAVERALQSVPPDERVKARQEVIDFLIGNTIIDQYLTALKITVEPKDVDQHIEHFKAECKKQEQDYAQMLKRMKMTEPELKEQTYNLLRWEKFVAQQATEEKLKALFSHTPEGFDGTTIRARHILLSPGADDQSKQETAATLRTIKAQIDKALAAEMAKLPPDTDGVAREKKKQALLEDAFSDAARKNSTCNSKSEGGDLRWFPRYGSMIDPFAKAAFALKPFEISDVVATPFGYHLILIVGRRPGIPTKFEDPRVKDAVKEVYEAKLKDAVIDQMKPRAKIEIIPVK